MPDLAYLECSRCHHRLSADVLETLCPVDAGPLYVRYDMDALRAILLEILQASGGRAVNSDDAAILASLLDWAKEEGISLSPEGAGATAAYDSLRASGEIKSDERVVLFNPGAGLKHADTIAAAMRLKRLSSLPTSLPVGGIITPV